MEWHGLPVKVKLVTEVQMISVRLVKGCRYVSSKIQYLIKLCDYLFVIVYSFILLKATFPPDLWLGGYIWVTAATSGITLAHARYSYTSQWAGRCPHNCPFLGKVDLGPTLIVPWTHLSPYPKQHLDHSYHLFLRGLLLWHSDTNTNFKFKIWSHFPFLASEGRLDVPMKWKFCMEEYTVHHGSILDCEISPW